MNIILTHAKLDQDALTASVTKPENGGLVTFLGVTRNHNEGRHVEYLEYEAYEEMALQELKRVAEQAKQKWPEVDIAIAHRLGRLEIGEVSLVIAVAAPHRKEAFAACAFAVDILKETVPIWKREMFVGGEVWVGSEEHSQVHRRPTT